MVPRLVFISASYNFKLKYFCFLEHPNQVVLTVSQQQWAAELHKIFDGSQENALKKLEEFEIICLKNLSALAAITRKEISGLLRKVLCALITIDVHAKDSVNNLVKKKVTRS